MHQAGPNKPIYNDAWKHKNQNQGYGSGSQRQSANVIENVLLRVFHMCFDGAYVFMWKNVYLRHMRFILFILATCFFLWERKSPMCKLEKAVAVQTFVKIHFFNAYSFLSASQIKFGKCLTLLSSEHIIFLLLCKPQRLKEI